MMTSPSWICSMPWCASRCWSPTGPRGGPGFRCWRRSASSPRNNSSPAARQPRPVKRMPAISPGRKRRSWLCGTARASARHTSGSAVELANLRTAFRWAADQGDLDIAATVATYAMVGVLVDNYEPIAWAEELIEPARGVDHPRLATLYVMAAQCWRPGRIEEAVGYADAGQTVIGSGGQVPFGQEGVLGVVYMVIGQPERWVEWCRAQLARGRDTHTFTQAYLVAALTVAGCGDEAGAAANGLIDAAEATHNPYALAYALYTYGYAFRDADPAAALETLRRGLVIAQDSGNRLLESHLAYRCVSA